jgi:hypothetical protein
MAQLRTLFGPKLENPSVRATLLLALAWGPAAEEAAKAPAPAWPPAPSSPVARANPPVRGDCRAVRVGRER